MRRVNHWPTNKIDDNLTVQKNWNQTKLNQKLLNIQVDHTITLSSKNNLLGKMQVNSAHLHIVHKGKNWKIFRKMQKIARQEKLWRRSTWPQERCQWLKRTENEQRKLQNPIDWQFLIYLWTWLCALIWRIKNSECLIKLFQLYKRPYK